MKKYFYASLGVILGHLFLILPALSQATANNWSVLSGGGGNSNTSGITLTSSIGQLFAGKSSNNTTTIISGFLGYFVSGDQIISNVPTPANRSIRLNQNFPNPFRSSTTISWYLPSNDHVVIKIFDFLGREMITLRDEQMPPGDHEMRFNGENFPDGMYILRIETGNFAASEIMHKIK
jgi:hypothetical protein